MVFLLRALGRGLAVAALLFFSGAPARAETPIPPAPRAWVTDTAALLSRATVSEQNARLREFERTTGHQILVYVAPTTGGVPIEDWTARAFKAWKVGRKSLDDGLVLFIFSKDRALRIEVGYGLEAKVPDVRASRIIRETIAPALLAGEPDRGVTEGLDRILMLIGDASTGASVASAGTEDASSAVPISPLQLVFYGFLLLVFIIIAIRSPWTAVYLLVNILGSRGGGGFSGEGGFSGGGGRSGGGGASGRW